MLKITRFLKFCFQFYIIVFFLTGFSFIEKFNEKNDNNVMLFFSDSVLLHFSTDSDRPIIIENVEFGDLIINKHKVMGLTYHEPSQLLLGPLMEPNGRPYKKQLWISDLELSFDYCDLLSETCYHEEILITSDIGRSLASLPKSSYSQPIMIVGIGRDGVTRVWIANGPWPEMSTWRQVAESRTRKEADVFFKHYKDVVKGLKASERFR